MKNKTIYDDEKSTKVYAQKLWTYQLTKWNWKWEIKFFIRTEISVY